MCCGTVWQPSHSQAKNKGQANYMRLNLLLPDIKPDEWLLKQCRKKECKGKRLYPRQAVEKKIVDGNYQKVQIWRYECARCVRVPFSSIR